jgi:hemolysin D
LARAEAEAKQWREELAKASQRSSLQRLVSSVDGTITQLAVHTIGGAVDAGRPLMVIVPNGGSLIVEAKLLNKDAGFVRMGQPVAVKLEAFPFIRHGMNNGVIETIGSDAANDEKLVPVFPVRIRLPCGTGARSAQS